MKVVHQKLFEYYAEVTPTTGPQLTSAHFLDPLQMLRSFRKWDRAMDITPEDKIYYTAQYEKAFLKYVETESCVKHRRMSVIKPYYVPPSIIFPFAKASGFGQSSFDQYDLSSDDEEYLTPESVAETTPGGSDHPARLLTAASLHLNSPPESPNNWGQVNRNLIHYHSDPMEISSTFRLPDIPDWWCQQDEMHSKYADLSNVAHDIISILPHGVGVQDSLSLGQNDIGWIQSITTGEMLREKVDVRQFAQPINGILAGNCTALDTMETENDLQLNKQVEERKLHRMAKVHNILKMWQCSQILRATQKESPTQNKQMTAIRYISDTEEIIKAS